MKQSALKIFGHLFFDEAVKDEQIRAKLEQVRARGGQPREEPGEEELQNASQKDSGAISFQELKEKFCLDSSHKLVESFVCALQMKILLQGRLYVTNKALCFTSFFANSILLFGKSTKILIPFADIKQVEKQYNAMIFDNSILVKTRSPERSFFFTSFLQRDVCFDVIKREV